MIPACRDPLNILIVDDDAALRKMITEYLQGHEMKACHAATRDEALNILANSEPDLILLDLHLGRQDGLDILRELRRHSATPVIIISGQRLDEIDRVIGLELGADDYLNKPFSLRELVARIRAVLRRRTCPLATQQVKAQKGKWLFNGWELRAKTRQLVNPEGFEVPLTKGEYALLTAFLEAPQRPLSREHLLQATRIHEDIFDRSINVQVLRLRRKLEAETNAPQMIQTQRGIGYIFTAAVQYL